MQNRKPCYLLFACSALCFGQQSLFESQSGDTSIFLDGQGGVVAANIGKSSIRFGYLHQLTSQAWGWGVDVSGTLKGDAATLLRENTPASGAEIRTNITKLGIFRERADATKITRDTPRVEPCPRGLCSDWLALQFGYSRSRFYTVDATIQPLPKPSRRDFDGYLGRVAYNQLRKTGKQDFLIGASIGVSRTNNTEDLNSVQVTDVVVSTTGGTERRAAGNPVDAFTGPYEQYVAVPVSADAIWFPGSLRGRVGLDLFLRSNVGQGSRYGSPGVGVFFSKAGQPTRPVGGLTVQYKEGRAQAALVVGWSF